MLERMDSLERRYEELNRIMSQPEVASDFDRLQELAREHAAIEDLVVKYREYKAVIESIEEEYGEALVDWQGDYQELEGIDKFLEGLL